VTEQLPGQTRTSPEGTRAGRSVATDQLFEELRDELYKLAMAGERKDHTLQPTALLHEFWLRLFSTNEFGQNRDRAHLLGMAAREMRRILIEHARRRNAEKRRGRRQRLPLDRVLDDCAARGLDLQEVHDALDDLAQIDEQQATIVTLRFFGDFKVQEVAGQLGVSVSLVEKEFRTARAWLRTQLKGTLDS